ncbi:MAG: amino acid permease [Algoriphagus sp.]|uniref:APC family permease n=1 Tax=Algoriphagus sp. TaxID=1872435 RepID=UPI0017BF3B60|nr:amino acid permease [Algoriphagus sp.]NVJ85099.1 amino acid permease [Algoriphagus sp.]
MNEKPAQELKREVGMGGVITNVLSISIGSGIFLLPALVYGILGHASILAYIFCGLIFLFLGLCFGELSSRVPDTGGLYVYINRAFGPMAGFIANILYWFGVGVLACGALMNALADIAGSYFPIFKETGIRIIFFAALTAFSAFLNIKGIKDSMVFIKILTWTKVISLMALVSIALTQLDFANISWEGFPEFGKIGEASILLIFAFLGGELALANGGEMKDPTRTGPIGFFIGIIMVILGFCTIHLAAQGVLGDLMLTNQEAPLAELAKVIFGETGFILVLILSFIAVWSTLSSILTLLPRILYAGAKDGLLHPTLSKIHPKYGTPYIAIIFLAILEFGFAASGSFQYLLVLVTGASLVIYFGAVLAYLKFRWNSKTEAPKSFQVPFGNTVGILTLIAISWVFFHLSTNELLAIGLFMLILAMIYILRAQIKKRSNQPIINP